MSVIAFSSSFNFLVAIFCRLRMFV
jgi:hypothetical protein